MTVLPTNGERLRRAAGQALPPDLVLRFMGALDRERMLHDLARHIPGATFQFYHRDDGAEGFHYVCPRALLLFGSFADWRRGRHVHPDDRNRLMDSVDRAIATLEPWSFEGRYVLKSGQVRWFQGLAQPTRRFDQVVFNGVLLDIHDRKRAEQQRDDALARERAARADADAARLAMDRLLASVVHELRAPLTSVLLISGLLAHDHSLSEGLRADLRMIRQNAEMESRLVSDLRDVAAMRAGKLSVNRREISLHAALQNAIDVCRPTIESKQLRLEVALQANHHRLMGDADRLCQVFCNLLLNAAKFTQPGGVVCLRTLDDEGVVRVEVSDSGLGMDTETLNKAFEPFAQGAQQPDPSHRGLGLGLAIARALVEAHDGRISVYSSGLGRGTTFTIDLPVLTRRDGGAGQWCIGGGTQRTLAPPTAGRTADGISWVALPQTLRHAEKRSA